MHTKEYNNELNTIKFMVQENGYYIETIDKLLWTLSNTQQQKTWTTEHVTSTYFTDKHSSNIQEIKVENNL